MHPIGRVVPARRRALQILSAGGDGRLGDLAEGLGVLDQGIGAVAVGQLVLHLQREAVRITLDRESTLLESSIRTPANLVHRVRLPGDFSNVCHVVLLGGEFGLVLAAYGAVEHVVDRKAVEHPARLVLGLPDVLAVQEGVVGEVDLRNAEGMVEALQDHVPHPERDYSYALGVGPEVPAGAECLALG